MQQDLDGEALVELQVEVVAVVNCLLEVAVTMSGHDWSCQPCLQELPQIVYEVVQEEPLLL